MMGGRRQIVLALSVLAMAAASARAAEAPRVSVVVPPGHGDQPIDGRLLLLLSTDPAAEPRMQIGESVATQMVFGMDVDGVRAGQPIAFDTASPGYPISKLSDVPAGDYYVQVVLHRYETFHRADGHTVKLPMDRGEGQHWNLAPGNLYSTPQKVTIGGGATVTVSLDKEIPPIPEAKDTKYIRHLKIQSALLTKFWGRPMFLSANVLVPEGFDEHPNARFPLMIFEDHFNHDFGGFRTEPPDPGPEAGPQRALSPRGLQPNPAGRGVQVLSAVDRAAVPPVSRRADQPREPVLRRLVRRELGEPGPVWRRDRDGADPGDREAVSWDRPGLGPLRLRRIDRRLGSAWPCSCSIRTTTTARSSRAPTRSISAPTARSTSTTTRTPSSSQGPHTSQLRPGMRNYLGETLGTIKSMNQLELVLGSHARSGEQFDIWQAVFGPAGDDGYPKPIFDKATGEIDHSVAAYWKEHYDLSAILQREWSTLGPKVQGKLHVYVGSADTYFLNNAVYYLEDFLKTTKNPSVRRRGEVRRSRGALLERRSDAAERLLAAALQHDVPAEDSRAHRADRAAGRGSDVLALLKAGRKLTANVGPTRFVLAPGRFVTRSVPGSVPPPIAPPGGGPSQ